MPLAEEVKTVLNHQTNEALVLAAVPSLALLGRFQTRAGRDPEWSTSGRAGCPQKLWYALIPSLRLRQRGAADAERRQDACWQSEGEVGPFRYTMEMVKEGIRDVTTLEPPAPAETGALYGKRERSRSISPPCRRRQPFVSSKKVFPVAGGVSDCTSSRCGRARRSTTRLCFPWRIPRRRPGVAGARRPGQRR